MNVMRFVFTTVDDCIHFFNVACVVVDSLLVLPVTSIQTASEEKLDDLVKNCHLDLSHHFRTNDTFSDQRVVGPIGFRTNVYLDQWVFGPMGFRTNGFSDQWVFGLMGFRLRPMGFWIGPMGFRIGPMGFRIGLMGRQTIESPSFHYRTSMSMNHEPEAELPSTTPSSHLSPRN